MFSAPRFQMSPPENAGRGRAPCLSPPPIARGGRKGARSPLGASPRHSPRLSHPDSARVRVSWNYRVQTGGPSPAPVQRAPRRPAKRAGRSVPKPPESEVCRFARGVRSRSAVRSTLMMASLESLASEMGLSYLKRGQMSRLLSHIS